MSFYFTRRFCLRATAAVATGCVGALAFRKFCDNRAHFIPAVHAGTTVPIMDQYNIGGMDSISTTTLAEDADGLCSFLFHNPPLEKLQERLEQAPVEEINKSGRGGVTPLMIAAYGCDQATIEALLDAGANTEAETEPVLNNAVWYTYFPQYHPADKITAVEFAILGHNAPAVSLLIERGKIDPSVRAKPKPKKEEKKPGHPSGLPPAPPGIPGLPGGPKAGGPKTGGIADGRKEMKEAETKPTLEEVVELSSAVRTAPTPEAQKEARRKMITAIHEGKERRAERLRRYRAQFPLEARLGQQLVGQHHAIHTVSSSIRRKENGWVDTESPLVMLFMGSSGIGKTKTSKLISDYLFDEADEEHKRKCFIRMDMTEYQSKHEVSKFIGAPPGYVGYESGGQLVTKLQECPNGVVLLDEVEKAHPDVLTVMLQAFDEGRLTDGQGKTVDCKEATFILTTNLAQHQIADEAVKLREAARKGDFLHAKGKAGGKMATSAELLTKSFKQKVIQPILRRHFARDEFLGRINEIIFFLPFTEQEQEELAEMELKLWAERARKKQSIKLTWSQDINKLAAEAYNIRYGARSIKYELDRMVIAPIARAQEEGIVKKGCGVHVEVDRETLKAIRKAELDREQLHVLSSLTKREDEEDEASVPLSFFSKEPEKKQGSAATVTEDQKKKVQETVAKRYRVSHEVPNLLCPPDQKSYRDGKVMLFVAENVLKEEAPKKSLWTTLKEKGKELKDKVKDTAHLKK